MTEPVEKLRRLKALIEGANEAVKTQHVGQPDVRIRRPLWKLIVEMAGVK